MIYKYIYICKNRKLTDINSDLALFIKFHSLISQRKFIKFRNFGRNLMALNLINFVTQFILICDTICILICWLKFYDTLITFFSIKMT